MRKIVSYFFYYLRCGYRIRRAWSLAKVTL